MYSSSGDSAGVSVSVGLAASVDSVGALRLAEAGGLGATEALPLPLLLPEPLPESAALGVATGLGGSGIELSGLVSGCRGDRLGTVGGSATRLSGVLGGR